MWGNENIKRRRFQNDILKVTIVQKNIQYIIDEIRHCSYESEKTQLCSPILDWKKPHWLSVMSCKTAAISSNKDLENSIHPKSFSFRSSLSDDSAFFASSAPALFSLDFGRQKWTANSNKAAYLVLNNQLLRQISLQEGAKNTSRSALHIFKIKKPFIIVVN